ncbi:MAG TPA: nuclear transport factor 2 family protein [Chitinophagaceae bacterium]|nr:nuclear transport factor 2 family protein [Chitinophagaceae bacterium]
MKSQLIPIQKKLLKEEKKSNKIDDGDTKDLILRHINSFIENDLDAVLSDYTNESVLITQEMTYKGPDEIRGFFSSLVKHFPVQNSSFVLDTLVADGKLAFLVWHGKTPTIEVSFGTDTFIIDNRKIKQQTFAGQIKSLI